MSFTKFIKFNEDIIIKGKTVLSIYGEFNQTTGQFNIYYNPMLLDEIENNKEEVQKQINEFKTRLKNNMDSENFLYNV